MTTFREPTNELPEWIRLNFIRNLLHTRQSAFDLEEAELLLEVLLDICPNAEALAHNLSVEPSRTAHKAMQKVMPLTDEECDDLLTKFERGGLGYFKVRPWYEKIMAARGIEVGE